MIQIKKLKMFELHSEPVEEANPVASNSDDNWLNTKNRSEAASPGLKARTPTPIPQKIKATNNGTSP